MRRDDWVRLRHMLDAAQDAMSFIRERRRADLEDDRMLVLSLVKCLEIIGEAAARVSKDIQREAPQIPWADIVGMRNRLIHGYYEVDLDRVWDTVQDDLPPLMEALEELLGSSGQGEAEKFD